jgi:hypothetical protein
MGNELLRIRDSAKNYLHLTNRLQVNRKSAVHLKLTSQTRKDPRKAA